MKLSASIRAGRSGLPKKANFKFNKQYAPHYAKERIENAKVKVVKLKGLRP